MGHDEARPLRDLRLHQGYERKVLRSQGAGLTCEPPSPYNMAWGDDDSKTLYLCARTGLYKIRLNIPGIRP